MSKYDCNYSPSFDTGLDELIGFVEKDHRKLIHRGDPDQHPIESISGLSDVLDKKVDSEEGKGLSTNDFTDDDLNKVNHIDEIDEKIDNLKPDDIGAISEDEIGATIAPIGNDGYIPEQYIPTSVYDFIVAYPIADFEELSIHWLSQTPDGDPLRPQKGKLYCLGRGSENYPINSLFRWATSTYVEIIGSGEPSDVRPIPNDVIDAIILGE